MVEGTQMAERDDSASADGRAVVDLHVPAADRYTCTKSTLLVCIIMSIYLGLVPVLAIAKLIFKSTQTK